MQDIKIGKRVYKGVYKIKAFDEDGNEIPFFDVSQSEVTEKTLVKGAHGHDKDGNLIEGTYEPNLEELTVTANGVYLPTNDGFSKVVVDCEETAVSTGPKSSCGVITRGAHVAAGAPSSSLVLLE